MGFPCPQCESKACKRNGYTRHGKQNHRCLDCGRQFSLEPTETEGAILAMSAGNDIEIESMCLETVS